MAFTLLELLMALTILGVLLAVGATFRADNVGWSTNLNAAYSLTDQMVDLARSEAVRQQQSVFLELEQATGVDGALEGDIEWRLFTMNPAGTSPNNVGARVRLREAELEQQGLSLTCTAAGAGNNPNNTALCEMFEFNATGRLEGGAQIIVFCVPNGTEGPNGQIEQSGLEGDLSLLGRLSERRAAQC